MRKKFNLERAKIFSSYAQAMGEASDPSPGYSEAGRVERNMRLYEKKLADFFETRQNETLSEAKQPFLVAPNAPDRSADLPKVRNFLERNLSATRMPLSFRASRDYWIKNTGKDGSVEAVIERLLVAHALNIYDGALWQIALTLMPSTESPTLVDSHTDRLLAGEAGDIKELRAWGPAFQYGDKEEMLYKENGFFFRMITDEYFQDDPLGFNELADFPNFRRVHHEDWKPIAGEQAWAVVIGPLQTAHRKYKGNIPMDSDEMRLALSILPAFEAMQSPVGAFYHAPKGTYGIHPALISVENNFSIYAALKMLDRAVAGRDPGTSKKIGTMIKALEKFFRRHAYDRESHQFYSSGFYLEERWIAGKVFASDCQTWGITALGPQWIDRNFGEGESYEILKNTVRKSGVYNTYGYLKGIGFSEDKAVVSVEWTCGAILAARELKKFYQGLNPARSLEMSRLASQMRIGIEDCKQRISEDEAAYLYSSERYFVPFGWWANAIPSTASSAWVILIDMDFNPFVLGGNAS